MRVVVTRPAHSGERTAARLRALGHDPVLLPLTAPHHDGPAALAALAAGSGAVAITSAEAVRALARLGTALQPHLARPLFAVGAATADAAAAAGFTNLHPAAGDGAALADLVAAHRNLLRGEPLTYLTGAPRTALFETRLAQQGIALRIAECYRMSPVEPDEGVLAELVSGTGADAILFYSSRTAERFFSLPAVREHGKNLDAAWFLCLSAAVAGSLPAGLRHRAKIAPQPDEDSLLGLLAGL